MVGTPVAQRVVPDDGTARSAAKHGEGDSATPVDKSALAVAAPRRYRNREHLRSIIKMPCLVCGRKPSDPHHLRYAQPRALGRKASDEFTVPLKLARKFWKETRLDQGRIAQPADRDRNDQLDKRGSADIYSP